MKKLICALALLSMIAIPASATTVSGVGGATVTKGKLDVVGRVGYDFDNDNKSQDNRFRSRIHFDYGVTEWWAPRLIVAQDKRGGDSWEHSGITFENRFELLNRDSAPLDLGFRLSYSYKDGDKKPDNIGFRLVEVFDLNEDWNVKLNQIVQHEVGEDAEQDAIFQSRAQATYKLCDKLRLGVESFNVIGDLSDTPAYEDQDHTIGPVLIGKTDFVNYEVGYRTGISEGAPNHSIKLFLSKSF